jgi:hypothetical protein
MSSILLEESHARSQVLAGRLLIGLSIGFVALLLVAAWYTVF